MTDSSPGLAPTGVSLGVPGAVAERVGAGGRGGRFAAGGWDGGVAGAASAAESLAEKAREAAHPMRRETLSDGIFFIGGGRAEARDRVVDDGAAESIQAASVPREISEGQAGIRRGLCGSRVSRGQEKEAVRRRPLVVEESTDRRSGFHDFKTSRTLCDRAFAAGRFGRPFLCCGHPTASAFFSHGILLFWGYSNRCSDRANLHRTPRRLQ